MSELGRNIRTIANTEELQRQINDLQTQISGDTDKIGIAGSRSIAYKGANGGIGKAGGGTDMAMIQDDVGTALDDFSDGLLDTFNDLAGNEDGTGKDGDANNLDGFTGDLDSYLNSNPQPGEQFKKLSGLKDCSTGSEIEIMLNGLYEAPVYEGESWENYSADDDPRLDNEWQSGYDWQAQQLGYVAPFSTDSWSAAQAGVEGITGTLGGLTGPFSVVSLAEAVLGVRQMVIGGFSGATPATTTGNVQQFVCTPGSSDSCPVDQPSPGDWPPNSKHQLSFDGAQFKTNDLEPAEDIVGEFANDTSQIDACTTSGDAVSITPRGDGGVTVDYDAGGSFSMDATGTVIDTSDSIL